MKVRFQSDKRGGIQQIMNYDFEGKENAITAEHLKNGEICKIVGYGQSMTPILKSGQPVICKPVTKDTLLKKNDIVLCKVKGIIIYIKFLLSKMVLVIKYLTIMDMWMEQLIKTISLELW